MNSAQHARFEELLRHKDTSFYLSMTFDNSPFNTRYDMEDFDKFIKTRQLTVEELDMLQHIIQKLREIHEKINEEKPTTLHNIETYVNEKLIEDNLNMVVIKYIYNIKQKLLEIILSGFESKQVFWLTGEKRFITYYYY